MVKSVQNIWINYISEQEMELRIDFNNDRHHLLLVNKGDGRDLIASKLCRFATSIQNDKHLNNDT